MAVTAFRLPTPRPAVIALAGAIALAVAMGIGRFAFTPVLPMMLHDGLLDIQGGSLLATANYVGYLVGALVSTVLPGWLERRGAPSASAVIRGGLIATALLTLAMALPSPVLWPVARFASGVASAIVFVFTSGWCLSRLTDSGRSDLGGIIFTGPGVGIAVSGLAATVLVAGNASAATAWMLFSGLAAVLAYAIRPIVRDERPTSTRIGARTPASSHQPGNVEQALFAVAYGLAGLGYIVTATFLPVIARTVLPPSIWLDLFWPVFGIAVAVGAFLTGRLPPAFDRRLLLAVCYVLQALGIAMTHVLPTVTGFILGSALVGLPFTAITLFAMQEARRLRPGQPTGYMGLMTALYGLGQIAGPPLVAELLARSATPSSGFAVSLDIAAASLILGAGVHLLLWARHPA